MANTNAPQGLKPVKHLSGAAWNQQANLYFVDVNDTNAYYLGDCVQSASGVAGDTLTGAPAVTLYGTRNAASASGAIRGVVVGVGTAVNTPGGAFPQQFNPTNLDIIYIPTTKTQAYYVWVVDDPSVIFEAQTDTLASAPYNYNAKLFVANAPTAPVNQSQSYVQGSTAASGNTAYPLKLLGAPWRADNDLTGTAQYAKLYVKINNHELANASAGV